MTEILRVVTVKQPYASQIVHGGKDVENRVRNIAGKYRGPVAIHAGLGLVRGILEPSELRALHGGEEAPRGAIIGVVELIGAHRAFGDNPGGLNLCGHDGQCSSWALPKHWHLELANPRPLAEPIPFTGALGLRTLDEETATRIWAAIA